VRQRWPYKHWPLLEVVVEPYYRVFDWQKDVPWTNDGTEQVIGRMKVRSRTMRGYKTKSGMLSGVMLTGSGTG